MGTAEPFAGRAGDDVEGTVIRGGVEGGAPKGAELDAEVAPVPRQFLADGGMAARPSSSW